MARPRARFEPGSDETVDWVELVAEARIEEAMEQGVFDDLPLKGRPLELKEYPFVPAHLRVPYKILHDAGFAPDWIERDKEIRELEERFRQLTQGHLQWLRREAEATRSLRAGASLDDREAARTRLALARAAQADALAEARRLLHERNAAVDRFNEAVPNILWQKARWSVDQRLESFRRACMEAFPELCHAGDGGDPGPHHEGARATDSGSIGAPQAEGNG